MADSWLRLRWLCRLQYQLKAKDREIRSLRRFYNELKSKPNRTKASDPWFPYTKWFISVMLFHELCCSMKSIVPDYEYSSTFNTCRWQPQLPAFLHNQIPVRQVSNRITSCFVFLISIYYQMCSFMIGITCMIIIHVHHMPSVYCR